MVIKLNRIYEEKATISRLSINSKEMCYALERPWKNNQLRISCIPEGIYGVKLKKYGKWHRRWEGQDWYKGVLVLTGTEPRTEILIHTANYSRQLNGCIAPGMFHGEEPNGTSCVWKSKTALLEIYPLIVEAIECEEYVELQIESNEINKKD